VTLLCVPLIKEDTGVYRKPNPLVGQDVFQVTFGSSINVFPFVLFCPAPPLTVQFLISGKQRKIAKYYKKQENLLKDFSEMETMNELGGLDPSAASEVQSQLQIYRYVQLIMRLWNMHLDHRCYGFPHKICCVLYLLLFSGRAEAVGKEREVCY
jgi:hypothetical protein